MPDCGGLSEDVRDVVGSELRLTSLDTFSADLAALPVEHRSLVPALLRPFLAEVCEHNQDALEISLDGNTLTIKGLLDAGPARELNFFLGDPGFVKCLVDAFRIKTALMQAADVGQEPK